MLPVAKGEGGIAFQKLHGVDGGAVFDPEINGGFQGDG